MQAHQQLLKILNALGVREHTRAVFRSLAANCEDRERLCFFVLESVRARVIDRFRSELVHRRSCGSPALVMTEELRVRFESEALNDEARRWMADFLLYPIGKRTRTTTRTKRLLGENASRTRKNTLENPRRGHPSADRCKRFSEVKLFPKSEDSVRLSRFRVLVDIFHRGYMNALRDKNLASRSNMVLIDRRWVSMFDRGAFHLCFRDEQICAVPLAEEATAVIPPWAPINRKSILRPRDISMFKSPIGPDKELVSLHALILQTWHNTELNERLREDMQLVDNMPSCRQRVSVLGDSMFGQIVQHHLALL